MVRRSVGTGIAVVSLAMILQAVVAIGGRPATARASLPVSRAVCSLSASGMASAASLHGSEERACRWKVLVRAADVGIVHENCTITGTEGGDVLRGTVGRDVICGYQGDDVIKGFSGRDILYGGAGKDRIRGGDGRDLLAGEDGNDRLLGGPDSDDLFGQLGNDRLVGGVGTNFMGGGYGDDSYLGGSGNDFVADTRGSDVAVLGRGRDQFDSQHGRDVVHAGAQNDYCLTVADGRGGDVIDGGPGNRDQFDADPDDTWTGAEVGPEFCSGC